MEQPLQLRWEITDNTLLAVESLKTVTRLEAWLRDALLDTLRERLGSSFATEKLAKAVISEALDSTGLSKTTALVNAVTGAIAVRDPEAPIVTDRAGNPKPDPDLRDYENIPLPAVGVTFEDDPTARLETIEYRTAIDDYMESEVLPYVPDAWYDPTKTKIGYEIPLTRHFYTYTPPRPLTENQRRNQSPRSRDPNPPHRGSRVNLPSQTQPRPPRIATIEVLLRRTATIRAERLFVGVHRSQLRGLATTQNNRHQ